jgi:hypothetical protein
MAQMKFHCIQYSQKHLLLVLLAMWSMNSLAETAFTYQGQLSQSGQAAQGQYDMAFVLYDADSAGNQVGVTLNETGIDVTDGVFEVLLDFGDAPFNNAPRWLEIAVREAGGGVYTTLSPRQRVGASPFAIETLFVAPGAVDTAALQNGAVTEEKIAEQAVTLGKIDNGAVVSGSIANGEVRTVDLDAAAVTRAKIADDAIGTFQVENNTITSDDIRNSTITALDVAGGLYSNKNDLYEVLSPTATLTLAPQTRTASCLDNNDLPIWGGCRLDSGAGFVSLHGQQSEWSNNTAPASVECFGVNVHPSNPSGNPEIIQAHMICLTVD